MAGAPSVTAGASFGVPEASSATLVDTAGRPPLLVCRPAVRCDSGDDDAAMAACCESDRRPVSHERGAVMCAFGQPRTGTTLLGNGGLVQRRPSSSSPAPPPPPLASSLLHVVCGRGDGVAELVVEPVVLSTSFVAVAVVSTVNADDASDARPSRCFSCSSGVPELVRTPSRGDFVEALSVSSLCVVERCPERLRGARRRRPCAVMSSGGSNSPDDENESGDTRPFAAASDATVSSVANTCGMRSAQNCAAR
mmetsp:Transcript_975/g.1628  ORF Transcript_975/g.1628 Transcript_975/m.1628 type:complete len:252 (-) Transcript_975:2573-3328(-)